MKKLVFSLLFSVLFSFVYFVFFSKSLYRTGNIINIYYPGAIILGIIVILILNKYFWSMNNICLIVAILGMVVFIFLIPLLFDALFGAQLRDLYLRGYENLLDIVSYYRDVIRNNLD